MKRTAWHRLVIGLVATLGLWLIGMALVPVDIQATTSVPASVAETDGSPTSFQSLPAHGLVRITVVEPGLVEVVLPFIQGSGRLSPDAVRIVSGDWAPWENGPDRLVATEAGSTFEIEGMYSIFDIGLVGLPGGGVVRVEMADTEVTADLNYDGPWRVVRADFGRRSENSSGRFGWRGHSATFASDSGEFVATLGQIPVPTDIEQGSGQTVVRVGAMDSYAAVFGGVKTTLAVLLGAISLVAVAVFVGGLARRAIGGDLDSWGMRGALGVAVIALPTGFLNYFIAGRWIAVLLVVAVAGLWIFARRRARPALPNFAPGTGSMLVVLVAAISVPLTATRGWALGYFQTDVVDYINMSRVFWATPSLGSGSHFGNGLRLIDFSTRTVVDGVLPLPPQFSILSFTIASAVLATVAVAETGGRLKLAKIAVIAVGAMSVGAGAMTGLWTEGYFSRHLFAITLLIATCVIVDIVIERDMTSRSWMIAGLVLAVPIAIVPTFVTIALPVGGLLAYRWWRQRGVGFWSQPFVGFSVAVLATAGPNMLWLKDSDVTRRYAERTSDIGRFIVVPFHATIRFPATLLGVLPFHDHRGSLMGSAEPGRSLPFLERLRALIDNGPTLDLIVGVMIVAIVGLLAFGLVANRRDDFEVVRVFLVATLLITALLGVAILREWPAQAYTILMYFWTLAPVVLLMIGLAIGAGMTVDGNGRTTRYGIVAGAFLVTLGVFNVGSSVLDSGRWMEPTTGDLEGRWNYEVVGDVISLEQYLDDHPAPETFALSAEFGEVTARDAGRVLTNLLVLQLEERSAVCTNCGRNPANDIVTLAEVMTNGTPEHSTDAATPGHTVLRIGDDRCDDGTAVTTGRAFALCQTEGSARDEADQGGSNDQ